jgi:BASS family bile acid:Na+ symporter
MTSQDIVGIIAILYCVANLGSMGLELNLSETIKSLRSSRLIALTLVWSWIIGPALAYLITKVLPLSEPHAIGLLVIGLAPTAPLLPILIRKARGDMDIAAAMMPLAVVGTVVLMPLMAPLLIPGASVSSSVLARQLVLTVLLPLVAGVLINVYASQAAVRIFPYLKKLAGLTTVALLTFTVVLYGKEFLNALGSFAVAAQILWVLVIGLVSYAFGFGMKQAQRSSLALGVCSRNGGATLVAFTAFPTQDPNVLVMLLLGVPVPVIVWLLLARFFGSRAVKIAEGSVA